MACPLEAPEGCQVSRLQVVAECRSLFFLPLYTEKFFFACLNCNLEQSRTGTHSVSHSQGCEVVHRFGSASPKRHKME